MMTRLMKLFVLHLFVVWTLAGCRGDTTTVLPAANIVVSDSVGPDDDNRVPFGSVQQGASSDQTVIVTNAGTSDLVLGTVASANPLAAPFSITADTCSGQAIARAGSCTIAIHFEPMQVGLSINGFDIPIESPGTRTVTVSVSGVGASNAIPAPNISVTDSVYPNEDHHVLFGNVRQGDFSVHTVRVTNTGTTNLVIGTVASANPLAAPFSIMADTCSGQTIAQEGSCAMTIRYAPAVLGSHADDFDIPSNDSDTSTATVTLNGAGLSGAGGYQMGGAIQGGQLALANSVTTFAGKSYIGSVDDTGMSAKFNEPFGVATDGTNLYVTDTNNHTIRKIVIATHEVTTLAGTAGSSGSVDDTGSAARVNNPRGITTDGTNLYVADTSNHTIRKIVIATREVTTFAGTAGSSGSADGTGSAARFNNPRGITTDGTNLYVADTDNSTIRKIAIATREVTTLAGRAGFPGYASGTGSAARFTDPEGITTDGTNLYVADTGTNTIRKVVVTTRAVTTVAGNVSAWPGFRDGTGTHAEFFSPEGITTDGTNLYVADTGNGKIRKIVIATRVVTTFADAVGFVYPSGITTDGTNLYAAARLNNTIWKAGISTGVLLPIAGPAGSKGYTDGTREAAGFYYPSGITTDGKNLYLVDTLSHTVRQIVISTGAVTTLAGTGGSYGFADGTGAAASFYLPHGITTDGTNLYVADTDNNTIRKIVISTREVTTLAGAAGFGNWGSADGTGAAARFNSPEDITTDGTNLYVADTYNQTIRKIVISTGEVTTLAGTARTPGSMDGTGAAARFSQPCGITTDGTNLYVTDNHAVRQIVISTREVTTLAGIMGLGGFVDGTGPDARFDGSPSAITTDGTNLYVVDNQTVRQVVISTGVVTTLAGTAFTAGSEDGTGSAARFNIPVDITTDGISLYVTEYSNNSVRKIQ